MKVKPVVIDIK